MHSNITSLIVAPAEARRSLQDFLAGKLQISRNRAKALIDTRNVFVNRRRVWMARHSLNIGDKIEINTATADAPKSDKAIRVLFQDHDYCIVDKPAGIPSNGTNSVEGKLRENMALPTLVAIHRLDKDSSGCLLFAKHPGAFEKAIPLFLREDVNKTYEAIASGQLDPPNRTVTTPIDGQRAATSLKTLSSNRNASHLLVTIKTGRTHQIRKHLLSIGNPVIGDNRYGTRLPATPKTLLVPRQMLHASRLEFTSPITGRVIKVHAPLPHDFQMCLNAFKLR
jgi:23S rRNA pseudouridine1911/1915/1917 synthase